MVWAGEASDSWLMVVVMSEGGKWSFLGLQGGFRVAGATPETRYHNNRCMYETGLYQYN